MLDTNESYDQIIRELSIDKTRELTSDDKKVPMIADEIQRAAAVMMSSKCVHVKQIQGAAALITMEGSVSECECA